MTWIGALLAVLAARGAWPRLRRLRATGLPLRIVGRRTAGEALGRWVALVREEGANPDFAWDCYCREVGALYVLFKPAAAARALWEAYFHTTSFRAAVAAVYASPLKAACGTQTPSPPPAGP